MQSIRRRSISKIVATHKYRQLHSKTHWLLSKTGETPFIFLILCVLCRCYVLGWLYLPNERSETGGYTVFTFVCLSVCQICLCVRTQSSLQQCIVRREMYSTCVWKVDNISARTISRWNLFHWLSNDIVRFKIEVGVQEKCKNVTLNTHRMAISLSTPCRGWRHYHDLGYINRPTQRSASKYTITACRAKVKFTWRIYALSERQLKLCSPWRIASKNTRLSAIADEVRHYAMFCCGQQVGNNSGRSVR